MNQKMLVALLCGIACFACESAFAYDPQSFSHELIQSNTRSYVALDVGEADNNVAGVELYVGWRDIDGSGAGPDPTGGGGVDQWHRTGPDAWTGNFIDTSAAYRVEDVKVGEVGIDAIPGLYVGRNRFLHRYTEGNGIHSGNGINVPVPQETTPAQGSVERVYRRIAIGDVISDKVGNELYFTTSVTTMGVEQYHYDTVANWGYGEFGSPTFPEDPQGDFTAVGVEGGYIDGQGTEFGSYDLEIGDFDTNRPGNELLTSKREGFSYFFENQFIPGTFAPGIGIENQQRDYYAVGIGDVDSTDPGLEVLYLSNRDPAMTSFSDTSFFNVTSGAAGVGVDIRPGSDRRGYEVKAGDLNNDGVDEIIVAAGTETGGVDDNLLGIFYLDNSSTWQLQALAHDVQFYDIALHDIDGNGFLDIMYGNDGSLGVFLNSGPSATVDGDFDGDGAVTAADYTKWQDNFGNPDESVINSAGDGLNGVDQIDYAVWKSNFQPGVGTVSGASAVPEPSSLMLTLLIVVSMLAARRRLQD